MFIFTKYFLQVGDLFQLKPLKSCRFSISGVSERFCKYIFFEKKYFGLLSKYFGAFS